MFINARQDFLISKKIGRSATLIQSKEFYFDLSVFEIKRFHGVRKYQLLHVYQLENK